MLSHLYKKNRRAGAAPVPAALAMLIGLAFQPAAQAALSDTFQPFVGVSRTYDDNLFRLPDGDLPGFTGSRSDVATATNVGVAFNRPIGRQILSGSVSATNTSFEKHGDLDYTGKNYLAVLEWHIGNHLDGHLGSSYAQTLTSFQDFHVEERLLRVQKHDYVDGEWQFHPSWQVHTGYSTVKTTYDLLAEQFNNRTEDQTDVGIDYLASSTSRVGLQVSRLKGSYPNHRLVGDLPIDDGYTETDVKANVLWVFSATSQFQMLAGHASRTHSYYSDRNASGLNGRGVFNWSMLRKLRMTLTAWREFGAIESDFVNSSLNKGASFSAAWDISAKLQGNASLREERRNFNTALPVATPIDYSDATHTQSLGLTYAPTPASQLGLSLNHETRSGNATGNYRDNSVSLTASIQF